MFKSSFEGWAVLKNIFQNAGTCRQPSADVEHREQWIKSKICQQVIMSWTLSQSTETCCVLESFCSTQTPPLVFTPVSIKCRQRKPWRKETNWSDDSSRQCDSTRIPEWHTPWKSIVVLMTLLMTHDDTKQTPIRREPESGTAAVQTNLENLKCCFEFSAKKRRKKEKMGSSGLHLVWEMYSKWLRWITARQLQ